MGKLRNLFSFITKPWRANALTATDAEGWRDIFATWFGTEIDENSALKIGTYYQCIRNIAEDTSKLPFRLIKNQGRKRIQINDDPLVYVFAVQANPMMTAYTFRTTMKHWAAGWGNAWAEIVRDSSKRVRQLWPIHPSRMRVERRQDGVIVYKVRNNDGSETPMPADRVFHQMGMSGDGYLGYSPAQLMTNTLGTARALQTTVRNSFENGVRLGGVLETDAVQTEEARINLRKSWAEMYSGSKNAGKTPVLPPGVKFKEITMKMEEAEAVALGDQSATDIAGWFRMPLYKISIIKQAQGWSTLDAQETDYASSCLMAWTLRDEQEIRRQLMPPELYDAETYPHFEYKGLLRGDIKTRTEFCSKAVSMGMMTPNEWRAVEDMDPIDTPAADKLYIQGAMVPLDKAGDKPAAPNPGTPLPDKEKPDDSEEPDDGQNP